MIEKVGNDYNIVTYKEAIDKDGKVIEVVDTTISKTMEDIDYQIEAATKILAYWTKLKSDAEKSESI